MGSISKVPEARVLAIASHVVYGYVGNKMATIVMQSLGCEVSAINTVHYSNHTGYKQVRGKKTPAGDILELYEGLKLSHLNDFNVLLSGYIPSAEAVQAVGKIGRDLKLRAATKPGSFFWVLDPVMGDDGRLYVGEDVVPAYKELLGDADLILPNQFEAELLSEMKIDSLETLSKAIARLHNTYHVPHIVVTSLRLSQPSEEAVSSSRSNSTITIVGSSARADHSPRLFRIDVPAFPIFFSGTGDMLAALTVARLREAVFEVGLLDTARWIPPDDIVAEDTPLAKAAEKVLASMHAVLRKTAAEVDKQTGAEDKDNFSAHLRLTRAAEIQVIRGIEDLKSPSEVDKFKARPMSP